MKTILAAALLAAGTLAVLPAAAQSPGAGTLPAMPAAKVIEGPAAVAGGIFVFNFKIDIASSIPASTPLYCQAQVYHAGINGAGYVETATSPAKRTGSSASCTMRIPYLWALANPAGFVMPQISVVAGEKRMLSHTLPMTKLPANKKTTTIGQNLRL